MERRFPFNHPLRKTWRKNGGQDLWTTWYPLAAIVFGVCVGLSFFFLKSDPANIHDTTPQIVALGTLVLGGVASGVIALFGSLNPDQSLFYRAIRQLREMFVMPVEPDTSLETLKAQAEATLLILADALNTAEERIGQEPHNNKKYEERARLRFKFSACHRLFFRFGLADKTWDRYFKN